MNRLWTHAMAARGGGRIVWLPVILLLHLATPFYQWFSRRHLARRRAACSASWRATVISVGNITVGGSGKTPVTLYLAQRFIAAGKKVAIVHSGYGRKSAEDLFVDFGQGPKFSVDATGDEVATMAQRIPAAAFAVGRNKKFMTAEADRRFSPDVIVIDDGFQRLDIRKNLDIVIVNPDMLRQSPRLFPGGSLREPFDALGRADAVFIMVADRLEKFEEVETAVRRHNSAAPILHWWMFLDGAEEDGKTVGLEHLAARRPYLFAGIGSFARMYDMVTRAGITPVGWHDFGDHHRYRDSDVERLQRRAENTGADSYLTTAKDKVKLAHRRFDKPLYCLRLAVAPGDPAALDRLVGWD